MALSDAKLRAAVVGVGYLGEFHAQKYATMPDVALVGVVDTDPKRAGEIAGRFSTTAYTDYKDLKGRVDAVSVVVPTAAHFDVGAFFLNAGVDVLVEKPMTETLDQAEKLIRLAGAKGRILQVGHLERFNPAVAALNGRVIRPMFIESHRLGIFKDRGTDVSVVLDLMIHDIDIILNFVKSKVIHISASGIPVVTGQVDIANARLEFENGCAANVTASRISTKNQRKIRLFQKDGYISLDFANREITIIRPAPEKADGVIPGMDIQQMCFTKADALEDEIKAFVHSVRHRQTPPVTGRMGKEALKIALSIMERIEWGMNRYL